MHVCKLADTCRELQGHFWEISGALGLIPKAPDHEDRDAHRRLAATSGMFREGPSRDHACKLAPRLLPAKSVDAQMHCGSQGWSETADADAGWPADAGWHAEATDRETSDAWFDEAWADDSKDGIIGIGSGDFFPW